MALDVQRNWDREMAEDIEQIIIGRKKTNSEHNDSNTGSVEAIYEHNGDAGERTDVDEDREQVYLPDEVLIQILDYTARAKQTSQRTLAACCRVSRQWHAVTVPLLYAFPRLYGHNFDPFVREICPSKNLSVRDSPLAYLVRGLDMSSLVHQATKSVTARLLGRTKGVLEYYVAPQRGFAMNSFPALSKCTKLRSLDLSLVSESPPLLDLFKTVQHLQALTTFKLPRSAGFGVHHKQESFHWPPNLQDLSLSGGIDAHFLHGVVSFPKTLRSLTIEHCPSAKGFAVTHLLKTAVRQLKNLRRLKIAHMPRLSGHALDGVLFLLPHLEELSMSVDYITPALFDENHLQHIKEPLIAPAGDSPTDSAHEEDESLPATPSLRTLELTYSGTPADISDKISPLDVMIAIDDGVIPKLRQIRVASSLLWQDSEAESLTDALQEGARKDWEAKEWLFADMKSSRYATVDWKRFAGVWKFDG